jgi:hypothetical protein
MNQVPLTRSPAQASEPQSIPLTRDNSAPAPATHRVLQTLEGKNRHNNHVIDVIDKTGDKSQTFGYLIHCQTCAWEGRYHTVEEATANAKMHVGL